MPDPRDKSLMRSLGEFVGHIVKGVKTPVAPGPKPAPTRQEVKREVREETRESPEGKMTLRRTTIEELEFHPDTTRKPGPTSPPRQE